RVKGDAEVVVSVDVRRRDLEGAENVRSPGRDGRAVLESLRAYGAYRTANRLPCSLAEIAAEHHCIGPVPDTGDRDDTQRRNDDRLLKVQLFNVVLPQAIVFVYDRRALPEMP